jgi:methionyl-tRNA synthetase
VPTPRDFSDADKALLDQADGLLAKARSAMEDFALHTMLADIWAVVAEANRYFASEEPWKLKKTNPDRMETVLYVTAETVRQVAILAQPAVPAGAAALLDLLAIPPEARGFGSLGQGGRLTPGTALPEPKGVFPRYVEAAEAGA